ASRFVRGANATRCASARKARTMKFPMMSMILAASLAACGVKARGTETPGGDSGGTSTLYDRLGKRDAIALVVKDFVEQRVAKDNRINAFFANADIPGLEA